MIEWITIITVIHFNIITGGGRDMGGFWWVGDILDTHTLTLLQSYLSHIFNKDNVEQKKREEGTVLNILVSV